MSAVKHFPALLCLISLFASASLSAQTESPATVPASFVGTYDTTFESFNPDSPLATGTKVTIVIGSDNSLCVDGVRLTDPVLVNGNPAEGVWKDPANSLAYAVSNFTTGFNEINVIGIGLSPFYGQLGGSKISDSESCEGGSTPTEPTTPVATEAINQIFSLAESKLPGFFPSGAVTLAFEQYVYRFYPATSVYLAFADDSVFLLGGAFGEAIVNAGSVSSVLSTLEALEVDGSGTGGGSTGGGAIELWNLSISGTLNTPFVQNLAFSGITLTDVPAPDLSNTNEINTEITSSLSGLATGISSISITVVNNSASRRTFDVSFSATATGLGAVTYNLRYDYTR